MPSENRCNERYESFLRHFIERTVGVFFQLRLPFLVIATFMRKDIPHFGRESRRRSGSPLSERLDPPEQGLFLFFTQSDNDPSEFRPRTLLLNPRTEQIDKPRLSGQ